MPPIFFFEWLINEKPAELRTHPGIPQCSRVGKVPSQDCPIKYGRSANDGAIAKAEVQPFRREILTTSGLARLLCLRSSSLDWTLDLGGQSRCPRGCILLFSHHQARDPTKERRTHTLDALPLSQLFFLKYVVVNVCTEKTNQVEISSIPPQLDFCFFIWGDLGDTEY